MDILNLNLIINYYLRKNDFEQNKLGDLYLPLST